VESVYSAVRTESLYKTDMLRLYRDKWKVITALKVAHIFRCIIIIPHDPRIHSVAVEVQLLHSKPLKNKNFHFHAADGPRILTRQLPKIISYTPASFLLVTVGLTGSTAIVMSF
jgi:hypothetical protein